MVLVKDIHPIDEDSKQISSMEDLSSICELPVLEACKVFFNLGIQTIMSSGNKNNVLRANNPRPIYSSENVPDKNDFSYGYGYAWIMLDYDSLNPHNREVVNSLCNNESCDIIDGLNDSAKETFFHRCKVDEVLPTDKQLIQLCIIPGRNCRLCPGTRRYPLDRITLQKYAFESLLTNPKPQDQTYIDFFAKAELLFTTPYKERVVILRYPVGEKTTVNEVSDYFVQLASKFDNNSLFKTSSKSF